MLDSYKLDEIVEEDRIRLVSRDQGRSVGRRYLGLGVVALVVFVLTLFLSYRIGPSLLVENLGPPLLLICGFGFIYMVYFWIRFSFVEELPSEIIIHNKGLVSYGDRRKKLRTINISPYDRITIKVAGNRVDIYHRDSLKLIAWYYRSSKFSAPDVHVSNVLSVLGRNTVGPENEGSKNFVHRCLGLQEPKGRPRDFLSAKDEKNKVRIDKHGEKYTAKAGYKFYSVRRRGGSLDVSIRSKYYNRGVLKFTVNVGEISYREHLFMTVKIRPQEVVGLVSSCENIDKGSYGYKVVIPVVSIFIKAKTGSTYELVAAKLEQPLDQLLAEDLYEETQRLCSEVNTLFLKGVE